MLRSLLSLTALLASCTPAPQKAAMSSHSANPETPIRSSSAVSPAANTPDSPEEAQGRRILSTAFVRMVQDGHMTVELRDGRVLVLNSVVMNPRDYCGVQIGGETAGTKYCGGYVEVTAARPSGAPNRNQPDMMANDPIETARGAPEPR
jgi:hypothetical protein